MNLAMFNFDILENFQDVYLGILEDFYKQHKSVYDKMFSDEIYGYRNGFIETEMSIVYFNYYLYSLFVQFNAIGSDITKEQIIEILNTNQWECVVKTLLCSGIRVGKYYTTLINLT